MQKPAHNCESCGGHFDVWSLAATHNEMGTWFVRDSRNPHFVGLSYAAMLEMIHRHEIGRDTVVRGPSTGQFWTFARRAPGLAQYFGRCAACQFPIDESARVCTACHAPAGPETQRNEYGLPPTARIVKPVDARPDFAGFLEDSSVLLVRIDRAASAASAPSSPSSTVSTPPLAPSHASPSPASASAIALIAEPTRATIPVRAARHTVSHTMSHTDAPTDISLDSTQESAVAQHRVAMIDSSHIDRGRLLERWNRFLLAATVMGFVSAVILALLYVREVDRRETDAAIAKSTAKQATKRATAADTQRSAPLAPASAPALPPLHEPAVGVTPR